MGDFDFVNSNDLPSSGGSKSSSAVQPSDGSRKSRPDSQARAVANDQAGPSNTARGCAGIGCLTLIVLMVIGFIGSSIDSQRWEQIDHSIDAVTYSTYRIKEMLLAPLSARFPSLVMDGINRHVSRGKNQTYKVHSWVDSQNRFGAMIRANYTVTLRRVGPDYDDFEILDIHIEE